MNSHFYVVLPSDSSMKLFPDNTVAHYTTKLSDRIHLEGQYEVALVELTYTNSFNNVRNDDGELWIRVSDGKHVVVHHKIEDGYFANETIFIDHLNISFSSAIRKKLSHLEFGMQFYYNEHTRHALVEMGGESKYALSMSESLSKILGFEYQGTFRRDSYTGEHVFDLQASQRLMYIHSDIASYAYVGATKSPLLRVCNTSGKFCEMVRTTFDRPFYTPVARNDFETILIHITDELGRRMPFSFGKSVATLHFRRRNNLLSS